MSNAVTSYVEAHVGLFLAFSAVWGLGILATMVYLGRKAEQRFASQSHQRVVFRETRASGRSMKSLLTKLGGANKVLDVVVTDDELWLKGIWPPFTYIGTRYDLMHRIRRSDIIHSAQDKSRVDLKFRNEAGSQSHVQLELKDAAGFLAAIGDR